MTKRVDDKDDNRKRSACTSFLNWLQALCIHASVLGKKYPAHRSGLFRHLDYKSFGGTAWFNYDENFRRKSSNHPGLKWGNKDIGLWLNLMLPQKI